MDMKDLCLADSAITHTIFQNKNYYSQFTKAKGRVVTVVGTSNLLGKQWKVKD